MMIGVIENNCIAISKQGMPLQDKDCAVTYNALLVGESAVGKTALLDRLMGREFQVAGRPTCGKSCISQLRWRLLL